MKYEITRPFLPPFEEYQAYLEEIYQNNLLTNNGPLVQKLELELKEFLSVRNIKIVSNGTIALQLTISAFELKNEIITTPFSYIATASSILWEKCVPVFADIQRDTLNIDPDLVEEKISPNTSGILATHVFGNPCDIERLSTIANANNITLIFDAAHAFGVKYKSKSILNYGDASTLSFHATKLFHTVEGGAVISNDDEIDRRVALKRNFGHDGPGRFSDIGINGKNSELHAAMGLCNLKYVNSIIKKRKDLYSRYQKNLMDVKDLNFQVISDNTEYNYAYFPIITGENSQMDRNIKYLNDHEIFPRRYFYPSLNTLEFCRSQKMPISEDIASRILCLPLYDELILSDVDYICEILKKSLKGE